MASSNIFISTSCVNEPKINRSIGLLNKFGFKNIELSGGSVFSKKTLTILKELKNDFGLHYLLHNYFPPPKNDFVINLSSSDSIIFQKSLDHCKKAIEYSYILGGNKIAFHAGFLIEIPYNLIGTNLKMSSLAQKEIAIEKLMQAYGYLTRFAGKHITVYLENNVVSKHNYELFQFKNPFLFTDFKGLEELLKLNNSIHFLLDIAHLKVSCKTCQLNFNTQLNLLLPFTDYIHISDNNGISDQNHDFHENSDLINTLSAFNLKNKTITLETYSNLNLIKKSHTNLLNII